MTNEYSILQPILSEQEALNILTRMAGGEINPGLYVVPRAPFDLQTGTLIGVYTGTRVVAQLDTDSYLFDKFGRIKSSDSETIADFTSEFDINPLFFETIILGSGTVSHDPITRSTVSTVYVSGSRVIRQQYQYNQYQPGKSQGIKMTFQFYSGTESIERLGYFDESDGIYLEKDGSTISMVLRSSTYFGTGTIVEERVPQSQWSYDHFDGTGPSRKTLNPYNANIWLAELQWLGVGTVSTFFSIDGAVYKAHDFQHSNLPGAAPYMRSGNLPIRYSIQSKSSAIQSKLKTICAQVESNGGIQESPGIEFTTYTTGTGVTAASGALTPILTISPLIIYQGFHNNRLIVPLTFDILNQTNPARVVVIYDGTLTNPVWRNVDSNSAVRVDTSASAVTGGIEIASFFIPGATGGGNIYTQKFSFKLKLPFTINYNRTNSNRLTIAHAGIGGNALAQASATWREIR